MSLPVDSRLELVVLQEAGSGSRVYLGRTRIVLGRREPRDRPSPDRIGFDDGTVSREHALLEWDEAAGGYRLVHRSRTNATVLNRKEVTGRPLLAPGDVIKLGLLELQLREVAPEPAPGSARRPPERARPRASNPLVEWLRGLRSPSADRAFFYRGLAAMLRAAVPLPRALAVLAEHCEHPRLRRALLQARVELGRGVPLSRALQQAPDLIPPMHSRLVAVGEGASQLTEVLERLAQLSERSEATLAKVRAALVHPLLILGLCLVVLMVVPSMVLRGLAPLLQDLDVRLPLVSRALFAGAAIAGSPVGLPVALAMVVGAGWFSGRALRMRYVRLRLERRLLASPGLGPAWRLALSASFAGSLSLLCSAGVSVHEGLTLAAEGSGSPVLEDMADTARKALLEGATLAQALRCTELLPPSMLHLVRAGEEAGRVADMLGRASRMAEDSVEHVMDTALATLQPAALALVGLTVGIVVVGTMAPLVKVVERL